MVRATSVGFLLLGLGKPEPCGGFYGASYRWLHKAGRWGSLRWVTVGNNNKNLKKSDKHTQNTPHCKSQPRLHSKNQTHYFVLCLARQFQITVLQINIGEYGAITLRHYFFPRA